MLKTKQDFGELPYALAINLDDLETESKEIIAEVEVLINDEVEFEVHAFTGNQRKKSLILQSNLNWI